MYYWLLMVNCYPVSGTLDVCNRTKASVFIPIQVEVLTEYLLTGMREMEHKVPTVKWFLFETTSVTHYVLIRQQTLRFGELKFITFSLFLVP